MSTISSISNHTPSTYQVVKQGVSKVAEDLESVAKAAGSGLATGASSTGSAIAHGLTAAGDGLSTLGRTINTLV
jgi:phage-related protein